MYLKQDNDYIRGYAYFYCSYSSKTYRWEVARLNSVSDESCLTHKLTHKATNVNHEKYKQAEDKLTPPERTAK